MEEDLKGAEFRECELDGARFVGVVMQNVEIDGLVTHLVVNGVDVAGYVQTELDRRYPVRLLIRSDEPADLREAWRQLTADWATTIAGMRETPGAEHESVNGEWSAVQTLRHLTFVHDSWFRRCCLGSTDLFTPMGIGPSVEPYRQAHGLDLSLEPSLDEVATVRQSQDAELELWLESVTREQLAAPAPIPEDDVWPPYARGRTVRQCLGTVLNEQWEHHRFTSRDLSLISGLAVVRPTPANVVPMAITSVLDFTLRPDAPADAETRVTSILSQTRARPGFLSADVIRDLEDRRHLVVIEVWESLEADEAYRAWRATPEGASELRELTEGQITLTRYEPTTI